MKFYIFDQTGKLTSSYDTRTQAPAYNTANPPSGNPGSGTGGGDGGTVTQTNKAILPVATFWTDTAAMPTEYRQMDFPVVQYDTSHAATMKAETSMGSAGFVSSLNCAINGPTIQGINFQVYLNGQPFLVEDDGIVARSEGTNQKTTIRAKGGPQFAFEEDDVLSVWLKGDYEGTNQSFSATIEVTYT